MATAARPRSGRRSPTSPRTITPAQAEPRCPLTPGADSTHFWDASEGEVTRRTNTLYATAAHLHPLEAPSLHGAGHDALGAVPA